MKWTACRKDVVEVRSKETDEDDGEVGQASKQVPMDETNVEGDTEVGQTISKHEEKR